MLRSRKCIVVPYLPTIDTMHLRDRNTYDSSRYPPLVYTSADLARANDILGYLSSGYMRVASTGHTAVPVAYSGGDKNHGALICISTCPGLTVASKKICGFVLSCISSFFVRFVPLFQLPMLTLCLARPISNITNESRLFDAFKQPNVNHLKK